MRTVPLTFTERRPVVALLVLTIASVTFALALGTALGHAGVYVLTVLLDLARSTPDVP